MDSTAPTEAPQLVKHEALQLIIDVELPGHVPGALELLTQKQAGASCPVQSPA